MKRFFNWLDRTFIKPVEESRMPLGVFILFAFGYILIRNFLEGGLESMHLIGLSSITLQGLEEMLLHLNFSWMFLLMAAIIFIRLMTGHNIGKVARVLLTYSFIICIPPLVDPLFRSGGYFMLYPNDLRMAPGAVAAAFQPWLIFTSWEGFGPYGSSPGMVIEAWIGTIMVMVYSGLRAKPTARKIISIILSPVLIIFAAVIAGGAQVLATFLPGDSLAGKTVYFTGGLIQTSTRKYALVLLLWFIPVLWLGLWLYNKKKVRDLIRSLNPLNLILGAVAAGAGFLFAWLGLKDILVGVPRNPFDYIALPGIMLMGAMVAGIVNLMVKAFGPSTSGELKKTLKRGIGGMLVLTLGLAWALGYVNLYFALGALFMGVLLALPPIRLERFAVTASLFKALSTFALVLAGYSLFTTERTFSVFPWQLYLAVFFPLWAIFLAWELVSRRQKKLHSESSRRSEFSERGESSK